MYRLGGDQPMAEGKATATPNTRQYCHNLLAMAPQRMQLDATFTRVRPSPVPAAANNLFTFLAQRFVFTYEANGLNCTKLLGQPDPIKVKTDGKGVAAVASLNRTKASTPLVFFVTCA